MGEMAALWCYEEHKDTDQLGKKLLSTTLELEKLKSEARNEMQKNREYVKQLINLVKFAIQERDEARDQLNKLLSSSTTNIIPENFNTVPQFETHCPNSNLIKNHPTTNKANSSVTESNSLSETYNNYHSHVSSPVVESFFETVTSPLEFSNTNAHQMQQQPLVQDALASNGVMMVPKLDQGSLIIDDLAKGRALPQRGKFLQAVLEAGPLLNTLLVAGPLPRWRNPPQMRAFDQIPSVSMKGSGAELLGQNSVSYGHSTSPNNLPCGSAQVFGGSLTGSGFRGVVGSGQFGNDATAASGIVNDNGCYRFVKRQRLC